MHWKVTVRSPSPPTHTHTHTLMLDFSFGLLVRSKQISHLKIKIHSGYYIKWELT